MFLLATLVSSSEKDGFDFDIQGCELINRAVVPALVKEGESFSLFSGNTHLSTEKWIGKKGIEGHLLGDVEASIRASRAFKGYYLDGNEFIDSIARKHNRCKCNIADIALDNTHTLIGVDLEYADVKRKGLRYIALNELCRTCNKDLVVSMTVPQDIANAGTESIKKYIENSFGRNIDFSKVITSREENVIDFKVSFSEIKSEIALPFF